MHSICKWQADLGGTLDERISLCTICPRRVWRCRADSRLIALRRFASDDDEKSVEPASVVLGTPTAMQAKDVLDRFPYALSLGSRSSHVRPRKFRNGQVSSLVKRDLSICEFARKPSSSTIRTYSVVFAVAPILLSRVHEMTSI